jgi:hypothetical protein
MQRLVLICITAAACVCLAACGSSGSPASSTGSTSSTTSTAAGAASGTADSAALNAARVNAAKCMRSQGIDIPDPSGLTGAARNLLSILSKYPTSKLQSAEKACAAQIKQAFPNATSLSPAQRAKRLQEAQAFSTCMRSHGIPFPDPASLASDPLGFYRALAALNTNSPAVKADATTCRAQALKDAGGG